MNRKEKVMKCNECGKKFKVGNRADGLPNGIGFVLEDGSIYTVCSDCVIKKGRENENSKET